MEPYDKPGSLGGGGGGGGPHLPYIPLFGPGCLNQSPGVLLVVVQEEVVPVNEVLEESGGDGVALTGGGDATLSVASGRERGRGLKGGGCEPGGSGSG